MTQILLQVAVGWLLLTAIGLILLSLLDQHIRDRLAPGAATVGALALVLFLSFSTMIMSVTVAMPIFAALLLVAVVLAVRRGTPPWRLSWGTVASIVGAVVIALPVAATVLGPSLTVDDSRVVSPTTNHDAFYYVTVSEWLRDNPGLDSPDIADAPSETSEPPAFGPAYNALRYHLRLGNELAQAGLNTVVNQPALETWTSWNALWILLVPGACLAAARILRFGMLTGWILGSVSGASALLLQQAHNQNSASLLAIAMAPLVVALVATTFDALDPTPLWLAAAALTAWMGTYTEYAVVAFPAFAGAVLIRPWRELSRALQRSILLLLLAAAFGPLAWYNTIVRLVRARESPDDPSAYSPFLDGTLADLAGRLLGAQPIGQQAPAVSISTTLILAVPLVLGLVLALVLSPRRGLWFGLLAGAAVLLTYLSLIAIRPYAQQRAVEILLPLLLLAGAAGWDALSILLVRRRVRPVFALVTPAVALLAIGTTWYVVNVQTGAATVERAVLEDRHVSSAFDEAAGWVRERGGPEGAAVVVAVPGFFDQIWLSYALRDESMVEFPTVNPSYLLVGSYWDGTLDRYLLVGRGALVDADDGMIVESSERFQLLDLARGEAVVAHSENVLTDRHVRLLRTDGVTGPITIEAKSIANAPLGVDVRLESGELLLHQAVQVEPTPLVLDPPPSAGDGPLLDMQLDPPPQIPPGATDLSIELLGITRER